jgi:flagellar motor component MotA
MLAENQDEFIQVSESISAITLIIDQRMLENVTTPFKGQIILEKEINLAAIIINSPEMIITTAGCLTAFYNQVSRRHVNIEDTVSCFTDTIIVVKMKDVGQAFAALTDLISNARKKFPESRSPA